MDGEELYKKHRPTTFKGVVGQADAVRVLKNMCDNGKVPHALLLTGGSGMGKTTLGRIIKTKLKCDDSCYSEVNCADFRGIDMVRDIRERMRLAPMVGKVRIYLIDECHKLSNDAQNAFLKILEDTPRHVHFILCTTDPHKLLQTIKTRCTEVAVKPLTSSEIKELLTKVAEREDITPPLTDEVVDKIINSSDGSARKALVLLNQIMGLEDEEQRLRAIAGASSEREGIELARLLCTQGAIAWGSVAKFLKDCKEEPETLRRIVLGYASSILLGGGALAPRCAMVIQTMQYNLFDAGKAGLVLMCWNVANKANNTK